MSLRLLPSPEYSPMKPLVNKHPTFFSSLFLQYTSKLPADPSAPGLLLFPASPTLANLVFLAEFTCILFTESSNSLIKIFNKLSAHSNPGASANTPATRFAAAIYQFHYLWFLALEQGSICTESSLFQPIWTCFASQISWDIFIKCFGKVQISNSYKVLLNHSFRWCVCVSSHTHFFQETNYYVSGSIGS